jgi:hypothetical protein
MKTIGLLVLSALVPSLAHADERFHAGISIGGVAGVASSNVTDAAAFNPTLHVDLGVRLDPQTAIYARGEIGTIIFASQAAAYLVGEWRPLGWLSLGTGVGVDAMAVARFDEASTMPVAGGAWPQTNSSWVGLSVPGIVGFTIGHRDGHALRIDLEAAAGYEPSTGTYGYHGSVSIGWSLN